jgi:hypothetical protein
MKVTPHQIKNLLNNAFGFVDKYGTLYHYYFDENDVAGNTFQLIDHSNGTIDICSFYNAEIINGSISIHVPNTEYFRMYTILVVATDGSNLLPQLLDDAHLFSW